MSGGDAAADVALVAGFVGQLAGRVGELTTAELQQLLRGLVKFPPEVFEFKLPGTGGGPLLLDDIAGDLAESSCV